jgi:endonuclease YncB( thermonuclease family)
MQNNINDKFKEFKQYDINTPYFTLCNLNLIGRVVNIIDGDSLSIILPIFNNYYKFNIRLNGIDTCEIKSKHEETKKKALKARISILNLITNQNYSETLTKHEIKDILDKYVILVWVECLNFDKYGRLLANIYQLDKLSICKLENSLSLSEYLLQNKLAYEYSGKTKLSEDDQLLYLNKDTR